MRKKTAGPKKGDSTITHFVNGLVSTGICDAMGESVSIQDTNFYILYQNKACLANFGNNAGMHCYSAYMFRDHTCEQCPLLKVYKAQGDTFTAELNIERDKKVSYYLASASGLRDRAGKLMAGMCIFHDITAHKHDDLMLKESDETYRAICNQLNDAIYLVDATTLKIVDCNKQAARSSGYSSRALKNMNIKDLYPSEEQDVVQRIFQKTAEMANLSGICGIHQSGGNDKLFPVELSLNRFCRGEKDYILASSRNIAERKEAEEQLRYEYEKVINILDASEDLIYIVNRKYEIEYINPALRKNRMPSAGQKCHDYIYNRKTVCAWCKGKEVFAGRKVRWNWSSPLYRKTYDISDIPLMTRGDLLKLSVLRDITSSVDREAALRDSEEQFQAIFKSFPAGIAIIGKDGKLARTNPAFKSLLGYSGEELHGDINLIFHPDELNNGLVISDNLLKIGENEAQSEARLIRKDGSIIWAAMTAAAVKDQDGKIKYKSIIIEDRTERKAMDEKLSRTAITDDMTGLLNRTGLFTIAEQQIKLSQRNSTWLSLLYIDLNGLQIINERFGLKAGDKALIDTTNILKTTFRASDVIARISGDEFAVLMTGLSGPAKEQAIIEHLQNNIAAYNQYGKQPYEILLGTGLTHYDPQHPCSFDELFNRAGSLMYKDKKQHKRRKDTDKDMTDRRSQKRSALNKECWSEVDGTYMVRIKDISTGGICLKSPWQLSTHSIHSLKIFPHGNSGLSLKGEVMWATSGQTLHAAVGLKFIETDSSLNKTIEEFIRTCRHQET